MNLKEPCEPSLTFDKYHQNIYSKQEILIIMNQISPLVEKGSCEINDKYWENIHEENIHLLPGCERIL